MKKEIILWTLAWSLGFAQHITLSEEQEKNWQIEIAKPELTQMLPLGDFVAEVVTPPAQLHTLSLPFDATIKKLNVALYQQVSKGEVLAEATGTEWIAAQQQAIADMIAYRHQEQLTKRKNMLCKEEIIPQKECVTANATLESKRVSVEASKALLRSYGASDEMLEVLLKEFQLLDTVVVRSHVDGRVISLEAAPGKSVDAGMALFVMQTKGALWLESHMEAKRTKVLQESQKVRIVIDGVTFDTVILQISPVINPENQTRQVRFLVPEDVSLISGLRANAHIFFAYESIKIPKESVIKDGREQIVFVKDKDGFTSQKIEILSEDDHFYFVKPSKGLEGEIASSSVAILKNMLGEEDE